MTASTPLMQLGRLKQRRDFLRVAGAGRKSALPGLVLQARENGTVSGTNNGQGTDMRIGITVTKKVGNAVVRNRVRRRLRAAAAEVMPRHAAPRHDYVLIGRPATLRRPFPKLTGDLKAALERVGALRGPQPGTGQDTQNPEGQDP